MPFSPILHPIHIQVITLRYTQVKSSRKKYALRWLRESQREGGIGFGSTHVETRYVADMPLCDGPIDGHGVIEYDRRLLPVWTHLSVLHQGLTLGKERDVRSYHL